MATSRLSKIHKYPDNPIELFKNLMQCATKDVGTATTTTTTAAAKPSIPMSLATLDNEFGLLNRHVIYRGLIDNASICFVTERNSRKYQNLLSNSKVALTILLTLPHPNHEIWQIRLVNAFAKEIHDPEILTKLWEEESLHAKIRSYICECGKPVDMQELEIKHNELLSKYEKGEINLNRTDTYTAFKVTGNLWDFYKSEPFSISDRLQYKYKQNDGNSFQWDIYHVAA